MREDRDLSILSASRHLEWAVPSHLVETKSYFRIPTVRGQALITQEGDLVLNLFSEWKQLI